MENSEENTLFPPGTTCVQATKGTRRRTLDILQGAIGHTPMWPSVRGRILRLFGDDGLEGFIREKERAYLMEQGTGHGTQTENKFNR